MYVLAKSSADDRTAEAGGQQTATTAAATATSSSVTVCLPYAEPSTSWAHVAGPSTSWAHNAAAGPSTLWDHGAAAGPSTSWAHSAAAGPSTAQTGTSWSYDDDSDIEIVEDQCPRENHGPTPAVVYDDSDDETSIKNMIDLYMNKRNIVKANPNKDCKTIVEYVNFKYIENNLRSIGLNKKFVKISITEAQKEFESFEKWFMHKKKYVAERQLIFDLRLPLFCHLYLSLYSEHYRERLHEFLNVFNYLFRGSKGDIFLKELQSVTDMNDLPSRILEFRKNKFVFTTSPEFLTSLHTFFQHHYILKTVFQEWFDINYSTQEDPMLVYEDYYNKSMTKQINQINEETPKLNNIELNISSIPDNKEKYYGDPRLSTSKGYFCEQNSSYQDTHLRKSKNAENDSNNPRKESNDSSEINEFTENSRLSIDDLLAQKSKYIKNDDKRKQFERTSSIECESRHHKKLRGIEKDVSCSENLFTLSGSNASEKEKKQNSAEENKERLIPRISQSKSNRLSINTSEDIEKQKSQSTKCTLQEKDKIIDITSDNVSSVSDTSVDYNSDNSSFDEEAAFHKYFRYRNRVDDHIPYETSCFVKNLYATKIDLKNFDDDLHLCLARQITLTNFHKLTCSIITSNHKYVAAGSMESLVYLWERSNIPTNKEIRYIIDNIKYANKNSLFRHPWKNKDFIEIYDKSTAVILRGHGGFIIDLAEVPQSNILLSASNDMTFRAWHLESKICLEVFKEHEHRSFCMAVCPNTLQVATGSNDGISYLWFLNYTRPLRAFAGHLDDVLVAKFHPNQIYLATGSTDKTIRIFELVSGECHRLLTGHSDYISCLEFHVERPNILVSGTGGGELIMWNIPTAKILWKMRVGSVLISELAWLTSDVLLASLITGVVLKCDVTQDYITSSKKVKGYKTRFQRLTSLKIIDAIVYTIGIEGNATVPMLPSINRKKTEKFQKEPSPLSKLFFPQHIIDNNGNSVNPLLGLSSRLSRSSSDLQYQINSSSKKSMDILPDFLRMNLQRAPFNLNPSQLSKLSSEHQSKNIKLVQKPSIRPVTTIKNTALSPIVQRNIQTNPSSSSQVNTQTANVQFSQQNIQQQNSSAVPLQMKMNFQHLQLQDQMATADIQPLQQQQLLQLQKQQLQPVRLHTQLMQNTAQQEQHQLLQLQQRIRNHSNNNIHIGGSNSSGFLQQTIRPNAASLLTKLNVQQQQQANIQLPNVNVPRSTYGENVVSRTVNPLVSTVLNTPKSSLSSSGITPIRLSLKPQKPSTMTIQRPTLVELSDEEFDQILQDNAPQTGSQNLTMGESITMCDIIASDSEPSDDFLNQLLTD